MIRVLVDFIPIITFAASECKDWNPILSTVIDRYWTNITHNFHSIFQAMVSQPITYKVKADFCGIKIENWHSWIVKGTLIILK